MKSYAVLSDIHSNFVALRTIMDQIDSEGIDSILCAGDLVGYNSQPNQVLDELRRRGAACIRGNHDDAVLFPNLESQMNALAAGAIRWTRLNLTSANSTFLNSLQPTLIMDDIAVYHGSPFDPYEYIYEDMIDEKTALASGRILTVLGHTHVPYVKKIAGVTVLNPGSVGQPRDGDARGSYAIIRGDDVAIRRVVYDIERVIDSNMEAKLPSELSERLRWGV